MVNDNKAPVLGRKLITTLATTFAAVAVVCAVLTMGTLYLNFQRYMEHETEEALSKLGYEIKSLKDDLLFHSDTLTMISSWGKDLYNQENSINKLQVHVRNWFLLSGVIFLGSGEPDEWSARGYDLSVFNDTTWQDAQVALHSKTLGEVEILTAIPDIKGAEGVLVLASKRLDDTWADMIADTVDVDISICATDGRVLASSFEHPPHVIDLTQKPYGILDIDRREYGYRAQRFSVGGKVSLYYVAFVPTERSKELGYKLGLVLFTGMAISFPLLFFIHRAVMGKAIEDMNTLVSWAGDYRRSPEAVPPPEGKFREIVVLSLAFGRLVTKLNSALEKIEGHNKSLEAEVQSRTAELREQHLLLDALMSGLPISVLLLDAHGSIVYANPNAVESLTVRPDETLPAGLVGPLTGKGRQAGKGGQQEEGTDYLANHNGRDFLVSVVELEEPRRKIVVATDVTERRAMEVSLLQAQKLESVSRLAGGVAHEFNNALASILPCVEMLRITVENERATGYIDSIENSATKGAEVVKRLLTFSRSGKFSIQPLDLNSVLENSINMLRPTAKQVDIKWRPAATLPRVEGSEELLQQLVLNLSLNSLDAMNGVGTLEFATWSGGGGQVFFSIVDDGPGVPAEVAEHIFEPFFSTKSQQEGTGLGLAVAYGVVERHNGRIRLMPTEGKGAKFEIELPAFDDAPEEKVIGGSPTSRGGGTEVDDIIIGG